MTFLASLSLLIPAFALLIAPAVVTLRLRRSRTLLYHPVLMADDEIRGFGVTLEPRYIFRTGALDQ